MEIIKKRQDKIIELRKIENEILESKRNFIVSKNEQVCSGVRFNEIIKLTSPMQTQEKIILKKTQFCFRKEYDKIA